MSEVAQVKHWDFDVWMHLAQTDPEKFEELRTQAIDALIESASEHRKIHLRRLQWRVDRVRERSGTPMAATLAISKMMWESFDDLRGQYQAMFGDQTGRQPTRPRQVRQSAKVLAFRLPAHA